MTNANCRYEVSVCEYAYNGLLGRAYQTNFTGKGASGRAIEFAREETKRASVIHVEVLRISAEQFRCNGARMFDYRNDSAVRP